MTHDLSAALINRLKSVHLVAFDVDGILTNGQLNFLANGQEIKSFHTLDGLGIKLLHQAGLETAIITGRTSPQVELRARALGITHLMQGREDKLAALKELWTNTGHSAATTAYIGDDLPDLSAIITVAFGATVPDGHALVRQEADWCTSRRGGEGAAREFCEIILAAQGKLKALFEEYR